MIRIATAIRSANSQKPNQDCQMCAGADESVPGDAVGADEDEMKEEDEDEDEDEDAALLVSEPCDR